MTCKKRLRELGRQNRIRFRNPGKTLAMTTDSTEISAGPLRLRIMSSATTDEFAPMGSSEKRTATATYALVTGPGVQVKQVLLVFAGGGAAVGDVRTLDVYDTPGPFSRLLTGGRMGVREAPGGRALVADLEAMSCDDPNWPQARKVDMFQVDEILGGVAADILRAAGALQCGTRAEVLRDTGKRRGFLCVTFPRDNGMVPLLAYTITRPLAVLRGFRV